jgi:hypothetical protein
VRTRDPEEIRALEQFLDVGLREFAEAIGNGDGHLATYWANFSTATFRRLHESPQEQDAR